MAKIPPGAVAIWLENEFGGVLDAVENDYTTGAVPISVSPNDPERVELVIVNLGSNTVFIALDVSVSITHGIQLQSNGGVVIMNVRDDGLLSARQWFAVSPGGASSLYVLQLRRQYTSEAQP